MAISANSNAPYTAAASVVNLMKRFRDKGLSFPVTHDVLLRAGVSESLLQRTLQSLVLLELIDEEGQPTEVLKKIRSVPEAEYKATLAAWLKQVYAEVFAFVDPATEDATQIRDAFRSFLPHAQQERMVKLFMALCAEAGLAPEAEKAEAKPRARSAAPRAAATSNPLPRGIARAMVHNRPAAQIGAGNLPPELAGLMARLPQNGWTQETRDKFMKTFESVLDYVIPIVAKDPNQEPGEGFA